MICVCIVRDMLGSKAFDSSDTELLCTTCSRNSQKFSCKQACIELLTLGPWYLRNIIEFLQKKCNNRGKENVQIRKRALLFAQCVNSNEKEETRWEKAVGVESGKCLQPWCFMTWLRQW